MIAKQDKYDAIVIGTGQGGKPLAIAFANAGWKTAVIEKLHVGGSCINRGCTPTKTMVASARVAYLANRAGDFGVEIPSTKININFVVNRKQEIVESFRKSGQKGLEEHENLDLIFGEASFYGPHQLEINFSDGDHRIIEGSKIFINTGAKPVIPDISGLEKINYFDSTSIMEISELPQHLLVIGGGYIGLEFAQMFRRFGSRVSIVQRNKQLLPREDSDVAAEITKILKEDGIDVYLESNLKKVEKQSNGGMSITVDYGNDEINIQGSHLLIATGRKPDTGNLNLEKSGLKSDKRGYLQVNDRLETDVPGIYAIGDVKPGPAFTHISFDDYRILKTNLLDDGHATIKGRLVPYTVFIDPQLGRIGLSEKEAKEADMNISVAKMPMSWVARAIEMNETRGFMKAVVNRQTEQILGCAVLGVEGGEIMSVLQMAMMGKVSYKKIRDGIFAHPTLAESLNNLFFHMK